MQPGAPHTVVAVEAEIPSIALAGGGVGALMILVALVALIASPRRALPGPSAPPPTRTAPPPAGDARPVPSGAPRPAPHPVAGTAPTPVAGSPGLVGRLREALGRSRAALQGRFDAIFGGRIDERALEELEETLLLADVGVVTAGRITDRVRQVAAGGEASPEQLRGALRDEMGAILTGVHQPMAAPGGEDPLVILIVGVNGSGKTTTLGKLAARYAREGHGVLLAAGDTYRAAAAEQLKVWAERAGADFVSHPEGADPGAVVYEALEVARSRGRGVVLIDTAGRLQTRKPLMEQLAKLRRVIQKHVPSGPQETLLVLDGTMGQNGLSQATLFNEATPLTGVVVTKLDGTAKGGMVLTIASELGLPVKFIGIGEAVDDLRPFEPRAFVEALA